MKKIFITGFSQSGKSTILKFLDSHSKLKVVHTHEKISNIPFDIFNLLNQDYKEDIQIKYYLKQEKNLLRVKYHNDKLSYPIDHNKLRKLLNISANYSAIEVHSYLKTLFDNSKTGKNNIEKFDFDFFSFDRSFMENIFNKGIVTSENFLDIFYENYFKHYVSEKKQNDVSKNIVIPEANECFEKLNFFIKEKFNFKCIFVYRNLKDLLYSKSLRSQKGWKLNNQQIERLLLGSMYKQNFKKRYYISIKKINFLQSQYPDNFLIIKLEDFLNDVKKKQEIICNFLNIDFENILMRPTVSGMNVSKDYFEIGDKIKSDKFSNFLNIVCQENINLKKIFKIDYIKYLLFILYYKLLR